MLPIGGTPKPENRSDAFLQKCQKILVGKVKANIFVVYIKTHWTFLILFYVFSISLFFDATYAENFISSWKTEK